MKNLRLFGFILFAIITLSSCSESEDEPELPQINNNGNNTENGKDDDTEEVRYYVKYEISTTTRWTNTINTVTYVSEKGAQTFNAEGNTNWSATYGPLSYGSVVSLKICSKNKKDYDYGGHNHSRIYVSKNQEPFVIKAEDSGSKDITLSYKIDF